LEAVGIRWEPVARVVCRGRDSGYKGISGVIDGQSGNSVRRVRKPWVPG
jgi:hypothetical protein